MPTKAASQATGLRSARFSPPRAPSIAVERAHLVARINESDAQITLICAPAGFGKSTLMQQSRKHFQAHGIETIWVRLERADNELGCFLRSLTAATNLALGDPATSVPSYGHPVAAGSAHGLAADLIDRLSVSEGAIVLFLDDLELIIDEEVWTSLQRVLADLDTRHRMVLASRTTPRLALGRIRADGRLLELDQTELRFTPKESQAYLERHSISAHAVRALQQHTEGWPAALQLAVVAFGRGSHALQTFSGASSNVAEYLAQEVLAGRSAAEREFLLRSSVLGEFCAELCNSALECSNSNETIAQLMRDNLLLSPIDDEERWYHYHPLFADFLRVRLQREAKEEFQKLHQRAALWTAKHGLTSKAVAHALAAQNQTLAAELLSVSAMDNVRSGRVADTARAIAVLPDSEVYHRPSLLRAAAFSAIFVHRYDAARRYMEAIERAESAADGDDDEITAMRLMLLGWTDRIPELLGEVEALGVRPSRFGPFTAGLVSNARAFCDMALGRPLEAERHLADARRACEPINALYVLSYTACFAAAIELNLGDLAAARATLEGAMNRAIAAGQRYGSAGAVVATYLTELLYEANELGVCQAFLDDYLPIVTETGLPDHLILLYRIAARLHFLHGRRDAGHSVLVQLNEIGARRGLPRLSAAAWLERSYAALRGNDVEGARRTLATGGDPALWGNFGEFSPQASEIDDVIIAELRLQLVTLEVDQALPQLRAALRKAESGGRRRRALRLLFLESQALEVAGRRRDASAAFDQAVKRAADGGLARVLIDDAWAAESLIGRSAVAGEAHPVELLRELGHPLARASEPTDRHALGTGGRASLRLTTREAQILRLVWKGGSNKAIARDLFLTENTIETHLRRIYEKLGTRKRTQAAALAREAGAI